MPDELVPVLQGVSGGYEEFGTSHEKIHSPDFDLVVTFSSSAVKRSAEGLSVLSFGAIKARRPLEKGFRYQTLVTDASTLSREVALGESPIIEEEGWQRLLHRSVVEQVPRERGVAVSYWRVASGSGVYFTEGEFVLPPALVVVGTEGESGPIAFHFAGLGEEMLVLPGYTTSHREWLVAFLERLRRIYPERYPARPDWRRRADWAPPALSAAIARKHAIEEEKGRLLLELERRIQAAAGDVEHEIAQADQGSQRLLAQRGEPLADAARTALEYLGFTVRDMDAEKTPEQPKLEDFRLTDPTLPGWECLVEVKGYTRGAKASDVGQVIGRPTVMYAAENHRPPSQVLLIVNAFCEVDPSERAVPLGNDPASLELLAANDGALIDTRDLFLATRAVEQNEAPAATVRESIRQARGRWEWLPSASEASS